MYRIGLGFVLVILILGCRFTTQVPKNEMIVCITFDDNCLSVYEYALPAMSQYGFRGTVFTNTGRVGRPRKLSWGQIDSLKHIYRWEIGGHTQNHEMLSQLSYQEAENTIATDFFTLKDRNLNPKSFATTFGYCPEEYYSIIMKYYKNTRTCFNTPMQVPIDRNLLGAYNVSTDMTSKDIVSRVTQGMLEKENLVILLFHEISTSEIDYFNNCNPQVFADTMKKLHQMGVKVLPLDEALDYLDKQ